MAIHYVSLGYDIFLDVIMRLTTIDTHQFIKSFTQAKDKEKQAEVIARTIIDAQESHLNKLVTKKDLKIAMLTTIVSTGVMITTSIGIMAWIVDKIVK